MSPTASPHHQCSVAAKESRIRNLFLFDGLWCTCYGAATSTLWAERLVAARHFGPWVPSARPLQVAGVATSLWGLTLTYWSMLRSPTAPGEDIRRVKPQPAEAHGMAPLWRECNNVAASVSSFSAAALWVPALGLRRITHVGRTTIIGTSLQLTAIATLQTSASYWPES